MKIIGEVRTEENPERYIIRYCKGSNIRNLMLQLDGDLCILTDFKESPKDKEKCKTVYEGFIDEFCYWQNAISFGLLLPDIALLRFFNANYK